MVVCWNYSKLGIEFFEMLGKIFLCVKLGSGMWDDKRVAKQKYVSR